MIVVMSTEDIDRLDWVKGSPGSGPGIEADVMARFRRKLGAGMVLADGPMVLALVPAPKSER